MLYLTFIFLMDLKNITLISFGYFDEDLLEKLAEAVKHEFLILGEYQRGASRFKRIL